MKYYCDGSRFRPTFRGCFHFLMILATPIWLLPQIAHVTSPIKCLGVMLSASGVWVCNGISAIYHIVPMTKQQEDVISRLDMFGILYMIAFKGSVVFTVLTPEAGIPLMLIMIPILFWYFIDCLQFRGYSTNMYHIAGYSVAGALILLAVLPDFLTRGTWFEIGCWGGGFIFNVIGGCIYIYQWPNPNPKKFGYHELFHVCHVCATILSCITNYSVLHRHGQRLAGL